MSDRTVSVKLQAITGQYEAAMARAGASTKTLGTGIESLGTRGAQSISSLTNGLVNMSSKGALAAGAASAAMALLVRFIESGVSAYTTLVNKVDAYQDVTGAAANESSRMVAVADAFGVSVDTLAGGMFRLAKNVEDNADGLAKYGVDVARAADGSVDLNGTLLNVADAYKRVGGGQAGALLAQEAFGRGGRALIDILERQRGEIEAVTRAAEEHGQIVSDDDITKVREYEVATRELSAAWSEFSRGAGALAVPVLTAVVDLLVDAQEGVEDVTGALQDLSDSNVADAIRDAFESAVPPLEALRGNWLEAAADLNPFTSRLYDLTAGQDDAAESGEGLVRIGDEIARRNREQADTTSALTDEVLSLDDALDELLATSFGAEAAFDDIDQAMIDLGVHVRDAREDFGDAANSLDTSTQAGLENREMWRQLVGDVAAAAEAMKEQGATDEEVAGMVELQRQRLFALADQLGFNREEVGRYIGVLGQVPGAVAAASNGTITVNTDPAVARVSHLIGLLNGVVSTIARINQALNVAQYGSAATDRIPAFQMPGGGGGPAVSIPRVSLPSLPPPSTGGGGGGRAAKDPAEEQERARPLHAPTWDALFERIAA